MSEAHKAEVKIVRVLQSALADNDAIAEALRRKFQEAGVLVINVIAAPVPADLQHRHAPSPPPFRVRLRVWIRD